MKIKSLFTLVAGITLVPAPSFAFNSGSTGADGAFNPATSTELPLPPGGIFNFTTVNIPSGVIVTFARNAANTPVIILVTGNVTIAGTLSVAGSASPPAAAAGDGNLADDGLPGLGGPGGFDGGRGGVVGTNKRGGNGLGPGGGYAGDYFPSWSRAGGGGGGGYSGGGANANLNSVIVNLNNGTNLGIGGAMYGASTLLPLIGGSGGGGGGGGLNFGGSGGGGGGGALLIASSGTVNVSGAIKANGGNSGAAFGIDAGASGGAGSGGAIRIIATTIAGDGVINAMGGNGGDDYGAGDGGRIRLEAENITRTRSTSPAFTVAAPGSLFVAGLPSLLITSVAGVNVTVGTDLTLSADTPNPVAVTFTTTGVPLGSTISLVVTPDNGPAITATSSTLTGSVDSASATASVNLPTGTSVLLAKVGYTVTTAMGDALSRFAKGERVKRVELSANGMGESLATLITVTGKKFTLPSKRVGLAS